MAKARNDFHAQIEAARSGAKYPAMQMVRDYPLTVALISKLQAPREQPMHDEKGNRTLNVPGANNFSQISEQIAERAHDADSILQLFPDMELSAQILISSIISPKDMANTEITYSVPSDLLSKEIVAPLLAVVKNYLTQDYKIEALLPKILRQTLFESGSYPLVVIPESSLDDFINGSARMRAESLNEFMTQEGKPKSLGILGSVTQAETGGSSWRRFATESVSHTQGDTNPTVQLTSANAASNSGKTDLINVYDNPYMLKFAQLSARERLNLASESIRNKARSGLKVTPSTNQLTKSNKLNDVQLTSLVYKKKYPNAKLFAKLKTSDQTDRENVGAPLIMKLSSESVIPVYTPGHVEDHVGYFILVDPEGNPVSRHNNMDHFGNLQSRLKQVNSNMSQYLTEKVRNAFGGSENNINDQTINRIFADVVESDLLARLRNGIYGQNIALGRPDNVYRLMLSRCLANQYTNLLYVPADLLTYFAYKYDEQGVGKSLLDDTRILNSLRAMMLFSRVMASVRNSIGRTKINMKLDEDDPNPNKTIEIAIDEITRTRQQTFPLGMNSPTDIVDMLQRAAYEITYEGHPGIPDVNIGFEEVASSYTMPDSALDDELKKRAIQSFGLSPEMVDNGFNAEFATTAVNNNLLLTKRVIQIQEQIVPQLTDHARKIAFNHGGIVSQLKSAVRENLKKIKEAIDKEELGEEIFNNEDKLVSLVVSEFLSNFELALPRPDSSTLRSQIEAFDTYMESLTETVQYVVFSQVMH